MGTIQALASTVVTMASFSANRLLATMGTFSLVGVSMVLMYGLTNDRMSLVLVFSMTADKAHKTTNHLCGGSRTKQNAG